MKGKTHDLNHDLTFSIHTINCVCHSIRSMFRVLGIYNFGCEKDIGYKYINIYFFNHSNSASFTWKLNRPSKPKDLFYGNPIIQTALPRCIDILWNRKKVDNFSPVASWIFLPFYNKCTLILNGIAAKVYR